MEHLWKQTVFLEASYHVSSEECAKPCLNKATAKGLFVHGLKIDTVHHYSIKEDQKSISIKEVVQF